MKKTYKLHRPPPLMVEMECVSKYALDILGVKSDYIARLRAFQKSVDPKTRCYDEYMKLLDRLAEYAAKLERQREPPPS